MRAAIAVLVTTSLAFTVATAHEPSPSERLDSVAERYFDRSLELQPLRATQIGDDRFDGRLPDLLGEHGRNEVSKLSTWCLGELQTIDPEGLDPERRITWRLLHDEATADLESLRFPGHLMPLGDAFTSLPVFLPTLAAADGIQPFEDVRDYEAFLARMRAFPGWVTVAVANMKEGVEKGLTSPRTVIERILPTLAFQASVDVRESPFFGPIERLPTTIPKAERRRLETAYLETIREELKPAYARLHRFLADEYLPASRSSLGLVALPNGKEWYRHLVRLYTTTDLEPEEIFRTGLAEADRVMSEMEALVRSSGHRENPGGFHAEMTGARHQLIFRATDLLAAYEAIGERVDQRLASLFRRTPSTPLEIRAMQASRSRALATPHYQAGRIDGSRAGIFFVNTTWMPQPKAGKEALYLHEAVPGHHFQIALAHELTTLPRYRRYLYSGAFIEGWALYAESLGSDLGLYSDQYQRFGRLRMELLRSARLMADVAIHHFGWQRPQVEELLERRALGYGISEIDRYTSWPGQALTYTIGELRFQALRKRCETTLGKHFDIRDFHEELLRHGALPLDMLEEVVESWLSKKLQVHSSRSAALNRSFPRITDPVR